MATNRMRCEKCRYEGSPDEFKDECPMCGSEDVFIERTYKCGSCHTEGSQAMFFPGVDAEVDPISLGALACILCSEGTLVQTL